MRKGSKKSNDGLDKEYLEKVKGMSRQQLEDEIKSRIGTITTPFETSKKFFSTDVKNSLLKAQKILEDDETINTYSNSIAAGVCAIFEIDESIVKRTQVMQAILLVALMLDAYGEEPQQ